MSTFETALRGALNVLSRVRADAALIGGHAVSARTEFRFTRDLDLALAVRNDDEAERVVSAFIQAGYGILAMLEATPADLDVAREALDLISARGFDRGKDLQAEYRALLARFRPGS